MDSNADLLLACYEDLIMRETLRAIDEQSAFARWLMLRGSKKHEEANNEL